MSVCSEFAEQELQQEILVNQTTLCLDTTNTTISYCASHQADANSGNSQYELCALLCDAGYQTDFGWTNCAFNIP